MSLKIVETKDGSQTVLNAELGSTYHSRHGAVTESKHVFIDKGLRKVRHGDATEVKILEMGFGTGLNALLTADYCMKNHIAVNYQALELYPLPEEVWMEYDLPENEELDRSLFERIHHSTWNEKLELDGFFQLTKHSVSLLDFESNEKFDVVYFDAFEPETQPELWTIEVFEKLISMMIQGGVLTTYCCKGYVRRNMIAAGFVVQKEPGPPGKREMIVAQKPLSTH